MKNCEDVFECHSNTWIHVPYFEIRVSYTCANFIFGNEDSPIWIIPNGLSTLNKCRGTVATSNVIYLSCGYCSDI